MDSPILVTGATDAAGAPLVEAVRPTDVRVRSASWGSRGPGGVSLDATDAVTWGLGPAVATTVLHDTARLGMAGRLIDDVHPATGHAPTAVAEFIALERATCAPSTPQGAGQQESRIP